MIQKLLLLILKVNKVVVPGSNFHNTNIKVCIPNNLNPFVHLQFVFNKINRQTVFAVNLRLKLHEIFTIFR